MTVFGKISTVFLSRDFVAFFWPWFTAVSLKAGDKNVSL